MRRVPAAGFGSLLTRYPWLRLVVLVAALWALSNMFTHPGLVSVVTAQPETNPTLEPVVEEPVRSTPSSAGSEGGGPKIIKQRTFLDSIRAGGYIGVIIILMSIVALGFAIEHAITIRKQRLMPEALIDQLEDLIARGDINAAIQCCEDPRNYSLTSEVVLAGLERYQNSEFGYADYKSAVEEAGEEYTAKLYRKTDALNIIGVIAPMLGLFGTVEGMMEAFNIIASSEGAAKPYQLADSISKALVTTWLGLVVAIPAMMAFSFFRNKIDSLVSECGKRVEHIMLPLSRKR
jgi:biopolymer transport protein ExbB